MLPADGAAVEAITRQSAEAAAWPAKSYVGLPAWVAEAGGVVIGFLAARVVSDEMEILNVAVDPDVRGRGAGSALLAAAIEYGRRSGSRRAFLEVRESNRRAQRFYERHGFLACGRRPRYYNHPEEDALLMALTLAGSG